MAQTPPSQPGSEHLRRASAATLKIVARQTDPVGAAALLELTPDNPDAQARAQWRGRVDASALRARFSDAVLHRQLAPPGNSAARWFDQLEQSRVEALGSSNMLGLRANLAAFHLPELMPADAYLLTVLRHRIGAPLPQLIADALMSEQHASLSQDISACIDRMAALLADQYAFALQALRLMALAAVSGAADSLMQMPQQPKQTDRDGSRPKAGSTSLAPDAREPLQVGILRRISAEPRGVIAPPDASPIAGAPAYRAFTTQFDRVLEAQDAGDADRRPVLERQLNEQLKITGAGLARWAHRLQRHLLARQMRAWQFDLEEGLLDTSRLTRVVTDPVQPLSFKQEVPDDFPATALTILVDCSGSMRGTPIAIAAACTELLGIVLERCGVRTEILGFTTAQWRGGRTREKWLAAGRPQNPGRLTDLLHIIFKHGDTPWRRARRNLAVMLDETLLKENVDGEALLWAHERLLKRPEQRRILMVISDGAPLDDATLAANDLGYLDRHLGAVIRDIECRSPVELYAIGIGHNVGTHYPRAFTVSGPEDLGEAMVTQLIGLFSTRRVQGAQRIMRGRDSKRNDS
jgi:cobaltochelatase CobT